TLMLFTFADGNDQIIALGAADYTPSAPEFGAGQAGGPSSIRWNWQVHGCTWPGHQHAQCKWFVHASIHAAQVVPIEFSCRRPRPRSRTNSAALTRSRLSGSVKTSRTVSIQGFELDTIIPFILS